MTGDTHLGPRRDWLPEDLTIGLREADLILHTGDFCTRDALQLFRSFGQVFAVSGNNEADDLWRELPERLSLDASGLLLEMTHGHRERGPSAERAVTRAMAGKADLVVFGHSHRVCWKEESGTWFLNPGSPTMRRREPRFSYAMLEIDGNGRFDVEFRYFDDQKRPTQSQTERASRKRDGVF